MWLFVGLTVFLILAFVWSLYDMHRSEREVRDKLYEHKEWRKQYEEKNSDGADPGSKG